LDKKKIAVLFGGRSGEHEVSLMSAVSVLSNMDKDKYEPIMIGITKEGRWMLYEGALEDIEKNRWQISARPVVLAPDPSYKGLIDMERDCTIIPVDAAFPVLHGPHGEDGTVQGLLELADIPYVGCGVLASSLAMDKVLSKDVFLRHGLRVAEYTSTVYEHFKATPKVFVSIVETKLGYPCFVKPANMGSSVGITKAHNRDELMQAIELAGKYDRKILVEEFIDGYEIECAVLGNDYPEASTVGQIVPCNEFYDYNAKYFDEGKSGLVIPADLPIDVMEEVRRMAVEAYRALDCAGMARVDFLVKKSDNTIYLNEVNTIPGFTKISMYPKLWDASGLPYDKLIDRLIELAFERYQLRRSGY
jgi:D-alanine-D-alanine ligase